MKGKQAFGGLGPRKSKAQDTQSGDMRDFLDMLFERKNSSKSAIHSPSRSTLFAFTQSKHMLSTCFLSPRAVVPLLRSPLLHLTSPRTLPQTARRRGRLHRVAPRFVTTSSSSAPSDARHIVLLSGGVESSTLLHLAAAEPRTHVTAMFFDYGQRAAHHELRACKSQCSQAGVSDLLCLDLRAVTSGLQSRSRERRHVPLYHRNGVLLSLGLSLAGQEGASRVSVAVCADDGGWYASASREFVDAFREVGRILDWVEVEAPLIEMSKSDVVGRGEEMGVDWSETWSCMIGHGERHCGRCVQCRARKEAFAETGVVEALGFYQR